MSTATCLRLDQFALMNWIDFENMKPDDSLVKRATTYKAMESASNLRKAIKDLSKGLDEWRNLFKKSGAIEPAHLQAISAFMRRMLGEGLIYKSVSESTAQGRKRFRLPDNSGLGFM